MKRLALVLLAFLLCLSAVPAAGELQFYEDASYIMGSSLNIDGQATNPTSMAARSFE